MLKIELISIVNKSPSWVDLACKEYLTRLQPYFALKFTKIKTSGQIKDNKNSVSSILKKEKIKIEGVLNDNSSLIVLDEKGENYTSVKFAKILENWKNESKDLSFLIGGAYGLDPDLKKKAKHTISLSQLTFTHIMVPVILLEQIYRANCIIEGHPYHKY